MAYVAIVPYADETYADAYFDDKLGGEAAWDAITDKPGALKQATVQIDQLPLVGSKCDSDQVREFPRTVDDCDDGIPVEVQNACCEVALALGEGKTPEALDESIGVQSESTGDSSISYTGERGDAAAPKLRSAGAGGRTGPPYSGTGCVAYRMDHRRSG